jgi:hypothetical protein
MMQLRLVLLISVLALIVVARTEHQACSQGLDERGSVKPRSGSISDPATDASSSFPADPDADRLLGKHRADFEATPLAKDPVARAKILFALSELTGAAPNTIVQSVTQKGSPTPSGLYRNAYLFETVIVVAPPESVPIYRAGDKGRADGNWFWIDKEVSRKSATLYLAIPPMFTPTEVKAAQDFMKSGAPLDELISRYDAERSKLTHVYAWEVKPQAHMYLGLASAQGQGYPGGMPQLFVPRESRTLIEANGQQIKISAKDVFQEHFWSDEFWKYCLSQGLTWKEIGALKKPERLTEALRLFNAVPWEEIQNRDWQAFEIGGSAKLIQQHYLFRKDAEPHPTPPSEVSAEEQRPRVDSALPHTHDHGNLHLESFGELTKRISELALGELQGSRAELSRKLFEYSTTKEPIFGGIVLGNRTSQKNLTPRRATLEINAGKALVRLVVRSGGEDIACVYQADSPTELWCAFHIVQPKDAWKEPFSLRGIECNLLTCVVDPGADFVRYEQHPALQKNTIGAAAQEIDALTALRVEGVFDRLTSSISSMQWTDDEPMFAIDKVQGTLGVQSARSRTSVLLRPSFWSPHEIQSAKGHEAWSKSVESSVWNSVLQPDSGAVSPVMFTSRRFDQSLSNAFQNVAPQVYKRWALQPHDQIIALDEKYKSFRILNSFARTLAVINWISDHPSCELVVSLDGVTLESAETPREVSLQDLVKRMLRTARHDSTAISNDLARKNRTISPAAPQRSAPADERWYVIEGNQIPIGICHERVRPAEVDGNKTIEYARHLTMRGQNGNQAEWDHRVSVLLSTPQQIKSIRWNYQAFLQQKKYVERFHAVHKNGRWAMDWERDGVSAPSTSHFGSPDQLIGYEQLHTVLQREFASGDIQKGVRDKIELSHCPFDAKVRVTDTLRVRAMERIDVLGYQANLLRIDVERHPLSELVAASSVGIQHDWASESIWVDKLGEIKKREIQLKANPTGAVSLSESQLAFKNHSYFSNSIDSDRQRTIYGESNSVPETTSNRLALTRVSSGPAAEGVLALRHHFAGYVLSTPAVKGALGIPGSIVEATLRVRFDKAINQRVLRSNALQEVKWLDSRTCLVTTRHPFMQSLKQLEPADSVDEKALCLAETPRISWRHPKLLAVSESLIDVSDYSLALHTLPRGVRMCISPSNRFHSRLASIEEALESREGDCSEFAEVFAALARARGIPVRIVLGLKYEPATRRYAGHSWNEVCLFDRWVPVDATVSHLVDASYLKIMDCPDAGVEELFPNSAWSEFSRAHIESIECIRTSVDESLPHRSSDLKQVVFFAGDGATRVQSEGMRMRAAFGLPNEILKMVYDGAIDAYKSRTMPLAEGVVLRVKRPTAADTLGIEIPSCVVSCIDQQTLLSFLRQSASPVILQQLAGDHNKRVKLAYRLGEAAILATNLAHAPHDIRAQPLQELESAGRDLKLPQETLASFTKALRAASDNPPASNEAQAALDAFAEEVKKHLR